MVVVDFDRDIGCEQEVESAGSLQKKPPEDAHLVEDVVESKNPGPKSGDEEGKDTRTKGSLL